MIGNPNSEEARDSYASWQLAIAILREKGVRSGLYAPRADNPDELRWAAEGPRPSEQLDVCAYTPPTDDGDYMSPPMKVVGTLHALPLGSPTLEQRLDAAAKAWRLQTYQAAEDSWENISEIFKQLYRDQVVLVCRAFAPELFKDTDTTTGQPMKPTEAKE